MRRYLTSLLVLAAALATAAFVFNPPQRNPDLEIAVVVAEQGWTPQGDSRIEDAIRDGL